MSYQTKIEQVRALLEQHNSQVLPENQIKIDEFFKMLTDAGGTTEGALQVTTWEDLQDLKLPKILARQVANIFREKKKEEEKTVLKKSKVESMTLAELVSHYDPRDLDNKVQERLTVLFGNKRFIVFKDDGSVNTEATLKLANELREGYSERDAYVFDGDSSKTYSVGQRPDQSFDENPLYPGRVLRPDGVCDQTNRSWSGVPLEVKQVLYLALSSRELITNSINDAHNIMDLVVGKADAEALKTVRSRFSKAAATLKELVKQNKAPSLKIYKKPVVDSRSNNPFGTNRTY